jgi:transcriptional regulator with XRE-family HTH domain
MDIRAQFGKNVRDLRMAQGRSQEQFAFDAGIHRTYVSGVERGNRNPSLVLIEKFASGLGVSVGDLLDYHLTVELEVWDTSES